MTALPQGKPRSVQHRAHRRHASPYVWCPEPIISPHADRLRRAAMPETCVVVHVPWIATRPQDWEPVARQILLERGAWPGQRA